MAPEGYKYFISLMLVALVCAAAYGHHVLTYTSAILSLCMAAFFRNPSEPAAAGPKAVLSPAGGWVIEIVDEDEPRFMKSRARRISIFMSPLDVHVNTAPVTGTVQFAEYRKGTFFKADRPEARLQNEQMSIGIRDDNGTSLLTTQVAGWLARRIICDVREGDRLERGRRYGLIQFGSRVDIHLPPNAKVLVTPGQHIRTAKTILAEI